VGLLLLAHTLVSDLQSFANLMTEYEMFTLWYYTITWRLINYIVIASSSGIRVLGGPLLLLKLSSADLGPVTSVSISSRPLTLDRHVVI
jgi:hypothetical protein